MAPQTSLNGLSNDVLLDNIDRILPDDISAFARVSKHIHTLASKRLKVHREKVRLYEKVYINAAPWTCFCDYIPANEPSHPAIAHALDLVLTIMGDPWIASCVRELRFVMSRDETECPDCQNGLSEMIEEQNGTTDQLIEQAFNDRSCIDVWRKITGLQFRVCHCSDCHKECKTVTPSIAGLLLLILLPNLVCLQYTGWDTDDDSTQATASYMETLIELICIERVLQQNSTSSEASPLPFSKLHKIVVDDCESLLPALPALALPTVHHLEATGSYTCFANALENGRNLSRTLQRFMPDLKTIAFENGWTCMNDVVRLIKSQPHLQSFTFELGSLEYEDTYIDEDVGREEVEEMPPWLLAGEADRCLDRFVEDEHAILAERGLCARVIGSKGNLPDFDCRMVVIEQLGLGERTLFDLDWFLPAKEEREQKAT